MKPQEFIKDILKIKDINGLIDLLTKDSSDTKESISDCKKSFITASNAVGKESLQMFEGFARMQAELTAKFASDMIDEIKKISSGCLYTGLIIGMLFQRFLNGERDLLKDFPDVITPDINFDEIFGGNSLLNKENQKKPEDKVEIKKEETVNISEQTEKIIDAAGKYGQDSPEFAQEYKKITGKEYIPKKKGE